MNNDVKTTQLDSKTIPFSKDSVQLISSYAIEANMTVRIPSEHVNDFVASATSDATIIYTNSINIDDRSIDYLGSHLKQQSRQNILNRQLNKDTLKTDEVLQLASQQESIIDGKMNNLRTDAAARYSTIHVHFTQHNLLKKESHPDLDLSVYQPPFYSRFAEALSSGLSILINIIIGISYVWPFIFLTLGGWMAFRYVQRRLRV